MALIDKYLRFEAPAGRVPPSPQNSEKALNINDLGPFSIKTGSELGQTFPSETSLYELLQEISERKKMYFFKPVPGSDYRPCQLTEGKEWTISFYVKSPETGKLARQRIKVNRIKGPVGARRKAARAMMAAIDERLALGWNPLLLKKAPFANVPLFTCLDRFIAIKEKELEGNSMRSYRSFIKIFRTWLEEHGFDGTSYPAAVGKDVALAMMSDIEEQMAAKTYNNYLSFFHGLFAWLIEKGYTDSNPFGDIRKKPKRLTKKKRRVLSDGELQALREFCERENPEFWAMCALTYYCCIRPKELALLRCSDIDLQEQTVHIRADVAKNDNESFRTIPDEAMDIIRKLDLRKPDWFLFGQHPDTGDFTPAPRMICSRKIAKWWDQHVRRALGFGQDIQFYSLKDTGITDMLDRGVSINSVRKQADHSSVAVTAVYVGNKGRADADLKAAHLRQE